MSDQTHGEGKRAYRKRRRAELEDETRLRITEATMELHDTVGPARTTVSAIADLAGVQRATVYRHFPEQGDLFRACSARWTSLNSPPDPSRWAAVDDPDVRLRAALTDLYAWFERTESMLEKLLRDRPTVPALSEQLRGRDAYFAAAAETILRGRPERGARRRRVRASIAHALEFETWRSLVRVQGLGRDETVELMARLVACAAA